MPKIALAFVLGFVFSFVSTKYFFYKQPVVQTEDVFSSQKINSRIKSISQNEYHDYLKLKDSAEKYKMADELLGKVMVLFLADLSLSLKNTPSVSADVSLATHIESKEALKDLPKTTESKNSDVSLSLDQVSKKSIEEKLIATVSENEALKLLKDLEIKDLLPELKNNKILSQKQLNLINGKFAGVVTFDDKKEPWRIEWDVNAEIVNGKVKGKQLMTLSNSKKTFSTSRGDGELTDFSAFAGDSSAILINSYGDDGYIQLYPFASTGKFFGNYYLKEKNYIFKKIGIVFLERMN